MHITRIIVIEDHPVVVNGLKDKFKHPEDGIRIVGSAFSVQEAMMNFTCDSFDLIVLDLLLPGSTPLMNLELLKKHFTGKPVVIFTGESTGRWLYEMYEKGAEGYLLKSADKAELLATFRRVIYGERVFPVGFDPKVYQSADIEKKRIRFMFNPVEIDLVRRISDGKKHSEIAGDLNKSLRWIEKRLKLIREKSKVKTDAQLIKFFFEYNIFL